MPASVLKEYENNGLTENNSLHFKHQWGCVC